LDDVWEKIDEKYKMIYRRVKQKDMATAMINRFRKTETTNTGVMIQTMQVAFDLFRTVAYDAELNVLEVKECGRGQVAFNGIAIQQHNNVVAKYATTEAEKVEILFESMGQYKSLYTNLELKGRGVSFCYLSDKGYKVYSVTKKAFEKIRSQHTAKLVEGALNSQLIA